MATISTIFIDLANKEIVCSDEYYKAAQNNPLGSEGKKLAEAISVYPSFTIRKKHAAKPSTKRKNVLSIQSINDYISNLEKSKDEAAAAAIKRYHAEIAKLEQAAPILKSGKKGKVNFFKIKALFLECFPNYLEQGEK